MSERFDYTLLDADVAQQVQTAVHRIRQLVKRTLEEGIAVGQELLAVKGSLPHGRFVPWLHAEFSWSERSARNFMTVAQRFGTKTAIIADLRIEPTAAYLLAAPSVPEEVCEAAIERAESGERITMSVAKAILGALRQQPGKRRQELPVELPRQKILGVLLASLESFLRRWEPWPPSVLARELHDFADSLEERKRRT